ncbi:MAG: sulfatase-like hydrolase/transferase, partial [Sphingobacteriales bacterium]|nr:sulfatase-like hydrolase/transferase [Sphingobacteriales bacterium]
ENATASCDTCAKPSVYFILLDEYFGSKGLKEYFNYDNSCFENKLKQNGFTIITNTKSNYHYTVFSMASILSMDYIKDMGEQTVYNQYGYYKATLGIRQNEVCKIFEKQGYDIVNYSDFDMEGHPAGQGYHLLPSGQALISNRTMYYQVKKNLPYFLARYAKFTGMANELAERYIEINEQRLNKTLEEAKPNTQKPSFTYLHLNMPHVPYAYDSSGNKVLAKWFGNLTLKQKDEMYLQYLIYTNKKIAGFIDSLQTKTDHKAIIILLSDHGYREALNKTLALAHENFFAVYEPQSKGAFQKDSITSVNTFRILLNDLFKENLPLVKDSLVLK